MFSKNFDGLILDGKKVGAIPIKTVSNIDDLLQIE